MTLPQYARRRRQSRLLVGGLLSLAGCGDSVAPPNDGDGGRLRTAPILTSLAADPLVVWRGTGTFRLTATATGPSVSDLRAIHVELASIYSAFPPSPTRPVQRLFRDNTEVTRIELVDDGTGEDAVARDGRFTSAAIRPVEERPPTVGATFPLIASNIAYEFADTTVSVVLTGTDRLNLLLFDADRSIVTVPEVIDGSEGTRRTQHVVSIAMPAAGPFPAPIREAAEIASLYFGRFAYEPDFLVSYQMGFRAFDGVAASYAGVRNDVSGVGQVTFDPAGSFAGTKRLQGVVVVRGGPTPTGNRLIVHELGHRWFNHLDPALGLTQFGHWGAALDRAYDGFTDGQYNDFELYLMGLLPADSVLPRQIGKNGVTIDEVIGRHGARRPSWHDAQREFTMAAVIVYDRLLTAEELALFEFVTAEFAQQASHPARPRDVPWTFFEATGGRARMMARIPQ